MKRDPWRLPPFKLNGYRLPFWLEPDPISRSPKKPDTTDILGSEYGKLRDGGKKCTERPN